MSAAVWGEPMEPEITPVEAHPNLGTASIRAEQLPARPHQRHGISIRVYSVSPDGTRTDLPTAKSSVPGQCGVSGCTCLKAASGERDH